MMKQGASVTATAISMSLRWQPISPNSTALPPNRSAKATASTRKFDRYGEWHYFALMARGLWGLLVRPRTLERWAHEYWYSDRR